uniref:hypothetical protein n=1 Tax=Roseibium sp. TaxID=1936156 RepID=UPI003D0F764E
MKRLIQISEMGVVAGLLLMASFFYARIGIGLDPSSQLAWRLFLEMPDLIREPANFFYYRTGLSVPFCAALFTTATVAGIILMRAPDHLRLRFLYFNASVLGIVVCLTLDLFQFPASTGTMSQTITNMLVSLRQIEPM